VLQVGLIKMTAASVFVLVPTLVLELDGFPELGRAPAALVGLVTGGIGITLMYPPSQKRGD
jgi:hypothetical protein